MLAFVITLNTMVSTVHCAPVGQKNLLLLQRPVSYLEYQIISKPCAWKPPLGRSPKIYNERDGVTWNFFFFSFLYSFLILPTPVNAPLTMIKYHLGQASDLFTSNEPIFKYCVCHTVAFFDFLSKNVFVCFLVYLTSNFSYNTYT